MFTFLLYFCTWEHFGQNQARLLIQVADWVWKALLCWGYRWEQSDIQASPFSVFLPISALGFSVVRTVGKQFIPNGHRNNRSQPTTVLQWSGLAPKPSPGTGDQRAFVLYPAQTLVTCQPGYTPQFFLKRKVKNLVKKTVKSPRGPQILQERLQVWILPPPFAHYVIPDMSLSFSKFHLAYLFDGQSWQHLLF